MLSESTIVPDDDDLSDSQIDFLLQRASLRAKSKNGTLATSGEFAVKLPKLNGGNGLPTPYTSVQNGIATIDEKKSVKVEQRQLAEKPRKIEEPVVLKKAGKKERKSDCSDISSLCKSSDEIIPNFLS